MSVNNKKIILKSASPRRKELLANMGYEFEIKSYDLDESFDDSLTIVDNVKRLGYLKASINKEDDYGSILIGCDTIVVLDNKILGKPKDRLDAFNMLKALSGKTHMVMSGLCVIYKNYTFNDCEISYVRFRDLSDDEINEYIDTDEPFGKAGAYAIQGLGFNLVDLYKGSLNNIIGLPTEMLGRVLGEINGMED